MTYETYETYEGAHPSIRVNVLRKLPLDHYILALKRIRDLVPSRPLFAADCTASGAKSTECTWGLCSEEKEAWPDAEDHIWPLEFEKAGRVAPLYRKGEHRCPLDRRNGEQSMTNGCFHTCRVFKPKKGDPALTREFVIRLYNDVIKEFDHGNETC